MWSLRLTILTFVLIWNSAYSQYEGEPCQNSNGLGVCQLIRNCPGAQNRVALSTIIRCGFDGNDPIVCCPNLDSGTPVIATPASRTRDERISSRECRRISTQAPIPMRYLIIEGVEAVENEFPHMAALGYQQPSEAQANPTIVRFYCGGTLISRRYVLTAAHCINSRLGTLTIVRLGALNVTNSTEASDFGIENTIIHPNYNSRFNYDDIALLRLNRDVTYTMGIQPACLHNDSRPVTSSMIITGWGITNVNRANSLSPVLLKATVSPVNNPECNTFYQTLRRVPQGLRNTQMCAVNETSDTCQGDSGGPLQIKHSEFDLYSVVGITSFGRSCGSNIPGVYIKISEYLDWIERQVWP